jgi:hypothetical protein
MATIPDLMGARLSSTPYALTFTQEPEKLTTW